MLRAALRGRGGLPAGDGGGRCGRRRALLARGLLKGGLGGAASAGACGAPFALCLRWGRERDWVRGRWRWRNAAAVAAATRRRSPATLCRRWQQRNAAAVAAAAAAVAVARRLRLFARLGRWRLGCSRPSETGGGAGGAGVGRGDRERRPQFQRCAGMPTAVRSRLAFATGRGRILAVAKGMLSCPPVP